VQFGVGVEYAFHSLFYMVDLPPHQTIGIRDIAKLNGIAETYLSKVFSKLRKAGIVRSVPGARGGYELAKSPKEISFWDVIEAIEGPAPFFRCAELRQQNIFVEDPSIFSSSCPCLIKVVIEDAEELMRDALRAKSLLWLHDTAWKDFPEDRKQSIAAWSRSI
jgi:Rrf2 family protein